MKKILILLVILGVLGGTYGLYLYTKPPANAGSKKTEVKINANSLLDHYAANESEANTKYLNKILLVTGEVLKITQGQEAQNIYLKTSSALSSVSCEMAIPIEGIIIGDVVSIQGQCTGYLMDVVLTKCVKR